MRDGFYTRLKAAGKRPVGAFTYGSNALFVYDSSVLLTDGTYNLSPDKTTVEHLADVANYTGGFATAETSSKPEVVNYMLVPTSQTKKASSWCYQLPVSGAAITGYEKLGITAEQLVKDGWKILTLSEAAETDQYGYARGFVRGTMLLFIGNTPGNATLCDVWAIPMGKFTRTRMHAIIMAKDGTIPISDMLMTGAGRFTVSATTLSVAILSIRLTDVAGIAHCTGENHWDESLCADTCKAFGAGSGYGLSPTGQPLTRMVTGVPLGFSFAGDASRPGWLWASVQGPAYIAALKRLLTRNSRVLTAEESAQLTNMKSISVLGFVACQAGLDGPSNVWDHHPWGKYQDEDGFWGMNVSGDGVTTTRVKDRIKGKKWFNWAGEATVAPPSILKYTYSTASNAVIWYVDGATTVYKKALNAARAGGHIDPTSSLAGMSTDVDLSVNQQAAILATVDRLTTEWGADALSNPITQIHPCLTDTTISGELWVMAHTKSSTDGLGNGIAYMISTLFTGYSSGDLESFGVTLATNGAWFKPAP